MTAVREAYNCTVESIHAHNIGDVKGAFVKREERTMSTEWQWQPQPEAAQFIASIIRTYRERCVPLAQLAERLHREAGTRLVDWVDHLVVDTEIVDMQLAEAAGFQLVDAAQERYWRHSGGIFPSLRELADTDEGEPGVAVRVESIEAFLAKHGTSADARVRGELDSCYRICDVTDVWADKATPSVRLWIVERHGNAGFRTRPLAADERASIRHFRQSFSRRNRLFADSDVGFEETQQLLKQALEALPQGQVCDLFFAAERDYWEGRNEAARVQRARQDSLGMGWANHDHHTYRSSRNAFQDLIATLELLGLACRERFYAGAEAGWGAQVLEQEEAGIVVFADVDLGPDEVSEDFSHRPLPAREALGTVGLWCLLHGESMLEAGMHHLECQFDFAEVQAQLAEAGISTMAPFTDLPFLKQAFTLGESWRVDPRRLDEAVAQQRLTVADADQFREAGAIGSHLEILERNDGYRGFNQTGISQIIRQTDPRQQTK